MELIFKIAREDIKEAQRIVSQYSASDLDLEKLMEYFHEEVGVVRMFAMELLTKHFGDQLSIQVLQEMFFEGMMENQDFEKIILSKGKLCELKDVIIAKLEVTPADQIDFTQSLTKFLSEQELRKFALHTLGLEVIE